MWQWFKQCFSLGKRRGYCPPGWGVRQMASIGPKRQRDGTWVYTLIAEALAVEGMKDIGVYIACR